MSGRSSTGRPTAFSYSPARTGAGFIRLFQVQFRHGFYTQEGGRCADFHVEPTDTTASLMASLGLLFKDEGAGFSVFVQPARLSSLFTWLEREASQTDQGPQFWSRLTFLMVLDNPSFVGVTALPIETRQSEVNLYGANLTAHMTADGEATVATLPRGRFMGAESLYPIVGSEVSLALPATAASVNVTDISGAVVLPLPDADPIVITDTADGSALPKRATLDLSGLAYDLYGINVLDAAGQPTGAPTYPRTVLYVPTAAGTMVLLDMLFTQPTPDSTGVYPIPPMFDGAPDSDDCGRVLYRLPFETRHTYWQYFVVSQTPRSRLTQVRIEGPGAEFRRSPDPVLLPDGREAILFTTDTLLPLRQKSQQHFKLSGRRRDDSGQENAIQVARLPVAPAAPVWPGPAQESTTGASEMFVYV